MVERQSRERAREVAFALDHGEERPHIRAQGKIVGGGPAGSGKRGRDGVSGAEGCQVDPVGVARRCPRLRAERQRQRPDHDCGIRRRVSGRWSGAAQGAEVHVRQHGQGQVDAWLKRNLLPLRHLHAEPQGFGGGKRHGMGVGRQHQHGFDRPRPRAHRRESHDGAVVVDRLPRIVHRGNLQACRVGGTGGVEHAVELQTEHGPAVTAALAVPCGGHPPCHRAPGGDGRPPARQPDDHGAHLVSHPRCGGRHRRHEPCRQRQRCHLRPQAHDGPDKR